MKHARRTGAFTTTTLRMPLILLALAQVTADNFASASPSGLRIERHGDSQRRAIALFLPETKYPSIIIEMPEHAWRKERATDEQSWFYKMYSSDPALRGDVTWSRSGNTLSYSMKTPSGFILDSKASLEADGLAIVHQVTSNTVSHLAAVEAVTCVKTIPTFFRRIFGTYLHTSSGGSRFHCF